MEFNEKLQELRKNKGLTQEELAQILYVSRTAISKWESGRGFPNIESLKSISKYFSVSLDELLSNEEILIIAEEDTKVRESNIRDLIYGLLDCGIGLLLFLPLFGQKSFEIIKEVSLISLSNIQPYLLILYYAVVIGLVLFGVLTLALQNCRQTLWNRYKYTISLVLSSFGVFLFIISQQPYASILTFVFLVIKALMLIKRR